MSLDLAAGDEVLLLHVGLGKALRLYAYGEAADVLEYHGASREQRLGEEGFHRRRQCREQP